MQITPIVQDVYQVDQECYGPLQDYAFASSFAQSSLASHPQDGLNYDPEATVTLKLKDLEHLLAASRHIPLEPVYPDVSLFPSPETDFATIVSGWGGSNVSEDSDIASLFSESDAFMGTPMSTPALPVLNDLSKNDLSVNDVIDLSGLFDAQSLFGLPPSLEGIAPFWITEAPSPLLDQKNQSEQFVAQKTLAMDSRSKIVKPKLRKLPAEAVQLALAANIASGVPVNAELIAPTPILAQAFPNGIRMPSNRGRSSTQAIGKGHGCTVCGRVFSRKFNLSVHMQTHNPDRARPFKCDYCGADFPRLQDLERHQTIHADPEFVCACGKAFVRRDALMRHQNKCRTG
jgi:hypothetical protein